MKVISHRGYWLAKEERNLEVAFRRSFDLGFGTETDVRDVAGQLVISHDMPSGNELTLDNLLDLMDDRNLPLAMNIKADGLADAVKQKFEAHGHTNWFVFDMAVPDMRSYLSLGVPTYTRMSEVEPQPAWLEASAGIWLDGFEGEWFDNNTISSLLATGKQLCIVSPELHGRSPDELWTRLLEFEEANNLMLCTDLPEDFCKLRK